MVPQEILQSEALSPRLREPELMDDPDLDSSQHRRALDGLRRINFWSRTSSYFASELVRWTTPGSSLRVLDLACGGGDVVRGLESQLKRKGLRVRVDGCDVSPRAVEYAQERADRSGSGARFFTQDVLKNPIPEGYDVLISSLFLHHLDEPDTISLLRGMAGASRLGILVSDLERRRAGYWLAALAPRMLTSSPVVHTDAVLSVKAALTRGELMNLLRQANLTDYRLDRHWPCRLFLSWKKTQCD